MSDLPVSVCPSGLPTNATHAIFISGRYSVHCECGWRGPASETEAEAVSAWNTRSEPSRPPGPDLISLLRALSRHEHDDHSIGEEAAEVLEEMEISVAEIFVRLTSISANQADFEQHRGRTEERLDILETRVAILESRDTTLLATKASLENRLAALEAAPVGVELTVEPETEREEWVAALRAGLADVDGHYGRGVVRAIADKLDPSGELWERARAGKDV